MNSIGRKDIFRHVKYPASGVVKIGVTQQEAGKLPDTLGE